MVKPLVLWCCGIINLNIHPQGKVPCHGAVIEGQSTYLRQCKTSMFQHKNFKKISVLLCYCFTELLWPRRYISALVFVLVWDLCPSILTNYLHRCKNLKHFICRAIKRYRRPIWSRLRHGSEKSVFLPRIIRSLHKDSLHLSRHPYTREFIRVSESSKNE